MKNKLALTLGTWFGCGFFPVAPGTVGSAAAVAIAWALCGVLGWGKLELAVLTLLVTGVGVWAAGEVERSSGRNDPGIVVIDEVAGQWCTLLGATAFDWPSLLVAFVLFRLFDILKPPPARQAESLGGGVGIMADDIAAGAMGALLLWAAARWLLT